MYVLFADACISNNSALNLDAMATELVFDRGTLVWKSPNQKINKAPHDLEDFMWDERTLNWRAPAWCYRDVISKFNESSASWGVDNAASYEKTNFTIRNPFRPRPHQTEAMVAWLEAGGRGTVVLPTGSGKSYLAMLAIAEAKRATMIVVPTIDLLHQWYKLLEESFAIPIGQLGGGVKTVETITVATYDSAAMMVDHLGNKFGLIIFDEVHHLPAPHYLRIAEAAIAPFRLGLTATPERADGKEEDIYRLVGEKVYESKISELVGGVLAPYHVELIEVPLSSEEKEQYKLKREIYTGFLKKSGIRMSNRFGWQDFVVKASYMPGGKEAFKAYLEQKKIAQCASAKLSAVWDILLKHEGERILIFTAQNNFAYEIGRQFCLSVLTHQTKSAERKSILSRFRSGELRVIVASKVLNEGVDVPEASVGVVVSGGSQVREHVQRLGRILRHIPGKTAHLYEVVTKGTTEKFVNQRRREHDAYE